MSSLKGKVIAIDFDGTCVTHEYPRVGIEIGATRVLARMVKEGALLILWTMRSGEFLEDAVQWFEDRGIPLHGIQRNPTQDTWTSSPKAYAHLYIDDAALGCPLRESPFIARRPFVDWGVVEEMLFMNTEVVTMS